VVPRLFRRRLRWSGTRGIVGKVLVMVVGGEGGIEPRRHRCIYSIGISGRVVRSWWRIIEMRCGRVVLILMWGRSMGMICFRCWGRRSGRIIVGLLRDPNDPVAPSTSTQTEPTPGTHQSSDANERWPCQSPSEMVPRRRSNHVRRRTAPNVNVAERPMECLWI